MKPRRLRSRVTLVATLIAFIIMTIAAFVMLAVQKRQLINAVDVSLQESVTEISSELAVNFGRGDHPDRTNQQPDLADRVTSSHRSLQLLSTTDEVLASSGGLVGERALVSVSALPTATGNLATVQGDLARYRIASATNADGSVLVAAYALTDVDQSIDTQQHTLSVAIPALSALLGLLIWLVLGRALKPVEAMREQVANISAHHLDRRVPVPPNSVELADLAHTMNGMLDRLDEASTRQNRFVSDAAHELRSPLAGIRGQVEVNLRHPEAPEREASEKQILAETIRMQDLVENLLLLARADNDRLEPNYAEVDLDDLVFEEASNIRRATNLDVRVDKVSAAQVRGDASQLQRVIRNLVDNAIRHAETSVAFELDERPSGIHLAVTDDGPGVPVKEAEAIFDRFTRLDESRQRDAGGSGLGLAICREIIERHGGTIRLDTKYTQGARFVVTLPAPD